MTLDDDTQAEVENVRVVIRVRPLNPKEQAERHENIVLVNPEKNVMTLTNLKCPKTQCKSFKFDHIFTENCTQMDLYQKAAQPIVHQIFQGYNGTILAYGQTGSGKTYTMSGSEEEHDLKGIIPNTFSHIFSQISRAGGEKSFVFTATYIEIYNEEVRDLLSVQPNAKLELRERSDVGVYVKGLTGFTVDSIEVINELMHLGNRNRTTRATLMNNLSSRSHAIFTITIEAKDRQSNKTTVAKLNLVDLAGSERLKRTQATDIGLKEASNINQSLFVLSNVISALVEEKSAHIPYRNSKLTRLLQDSLGGNSKTVMIAAISPSGTDYDESLCTLRYASRAKLIKNHIHLNLQTDKGLIERFEQEISDLQKRLEEVSVDTRQLKIKKSKSGEISNKQAEFLGIERVKTELNQKISSIQHKILSGGQNLFDKAEEQQFLLESSFEEIENLDRSHQELQGLLEEKEVQQYDLREQFSSLQEEDEMLDERIEKLQKLLGNLKETLEDDKQGHTQELNTLFEHNQSLNRELQLTDFVIITTIPKNKLKKIDANVTWNSEICDFQVNGIAHVGNSRKKPKRRFKKHIPQSVRLGVLFNERKNIMRESEVVVKRTTTKNKYYQYRKRKPFLLFEEGGDYNIM